MKARMREMKPARTVRAGILAIECRQPTVQCGARVLEIDRVSHAGHLP
jgi:hypothetical protein